MYLPTEPAQDLREDGSRPSQTGIASVPSLVVFSGGSAANAIVSMLKSITHNVAYVMPVSDDGGSTSEIVKVVGGPGIGDIRSRLVRLSDTTSREAKAVYELLSYRLPATQPQDQYETSPAKIEWLNILEGNHRLWAGISLPYRETIRAFLLQFHYKILQEIGGGGLAKTAAWFEFRGGSVGNFFLSGCRLFFDSLEAAVFQFARVTRCPPDTQVLPIVATAHNPVAIGVSLRNGSAVHGQCEISHPGTTTDPSRSTALQGRVSAGSGTSLHTGDSHQSKSMDTSVPDSGPPASLNTSSNLFFSKGHSEVPPLPSPIRRVFYINSELAETFPKLNTLVPEHLETKKSIIYSMGSLYTSLLPCLVVAGVGSLIAQDFVERRKKLRAEVGKLLDDAHCLSPAEVGQNAGPVPSVTRTSGAPKTFISTATSPFIVPTSLSDDPSDDAGLFLEAPALNMPSKSKTIPSRPHSVSYAVPESPPHQSTTPPLKLPPRMTRAHSTPTTTDAVPDKVKILLLNGTHDRETAGYTALDFILAITDTLNYSVIAEHGGGEAVRKVMTMRDAATDMRGAEAVWRWSGIPSLQEEVCGIRRAASYESVDSLDGSVGRDEEELLEMIAGDGRGYLVKPYPPRAYITHVLYADDGEVDVDVDRIDALGIRCMVVPRMGSMEGCERKSASELLRMAGTDVKRVRGHFGTEELRSVLEPILL